MRPPILLSLPKKEKEKLEALLHNEKNAKQWRRYMAILLCCEKPRKEAAKIVGIDKSNLERWLAKYRIEDIRGLQIKKQPGRPSVISKKKQEKIKKIVDSDPHGWSTKQMRELVYEKSGIRYSKRHIYRIAQKWGFAEVTPRPKSRRQASRSTIYRFKKSRKSSQ